MSLVIIVKSDEKRSKVFLMFFPIALDEDFWFQIRFLCVDFNWRAVHVRRTDVDRVVYDELEKTRVDISLDIFQKMTDMDWTVSIRKSSSNYGGRRLATDGSGTFERS